MACRRHNSRFFAVVPDPANSDINRGLSTNQKVVLFPTIDSSAFVSNINASRLAGFTLALDFPFAAFPQNLGHWVELVVPIFNVMQRADWAHKQSEADEDSKPMIGAVLAGYVQDVAYLLKGFNTRCLEAGRSANRNGSLARIVAVTNRLSLPLL
jgi:hypothetical protein